MLLLGDVLGMVPELCCTAHGQLFVGAGQSQEQAGVTEMKEGLLCARRDVMAHSNGEEPFLKRVEKLLLCLFCLFGVVFFCFFK